jgi:hypothetical protein
MKKKKKMGMTRRGGRKRRAERGAGAAVWEHEKGTTGERRERRERREETGREIKIRRGRGKR